MTIEIIEKEIKIKNLSVGVVISRPKQMYAWPGIVKLSENEILVAASERCYHCCPFGREVIVRSLDGGESWSLPQEVHNSELDDRDANLAVTPDGTLILGWFTSTAFEGHWKERASRITDKMRNDLIGSWMRVSKDKGHNWEESLRMPVGAHISPVAISDGSIITIGEEPRNEAALAVYKSQDLGQSWNKAGKIPCQRLWYEESKSKRLMINENHILEISPGRLIAMFRSDPVGDGYLYQSASEDYGKHWSNPQKTNIWGYPPQLLKLHNGVIMCSYGYRREPYSIRAVFSYDEGKTWDTDNIATLYEWEDEPDMGYPSSVELSPGKIMTVFYCSRRDKKHPETLPEGILSTTFTLENY